MTKIFKASLQYASFLLFFLMCEEVANAQSSCVYISTQKNSTVLNCNNTSIELKAFSCYSTPIYENFNSGSWNGSNFELGSAGIAGGSANNNAYRSSTGTRGPLRTVNTFTPDATHILTVSATLTFDDPYNVGYIAFIATRSSGQINNDQDELDGTKFRIHNFQNGQTTLPDGSDVRDLDPAWPGDAFYSNPIRVTMIDNGTSIVCILRNLVTNFVFTQTVNTSSSDGSHVAFSGEGNYWDDIEITFSDPSATYSWSNSLGTSQTATVSSPNTYTVTTSGTCSGSKSIVISQNLPTAGITNNTGSTELTCSRTSISLTGTGGGTYSWSNGASTVSSVAALNVSTPNTYTLTVTDANSCTDTETITISQNITSPSSPTAGNAARCSTGTVTISATPVSSEAIDWYAASTGGSAISSGSTSYTTTSISSTTTYYAQARNSTTGCLSASRTAVTATINPLPSTPTISAGGATTFNYGGSVLLSAPKPITSQGNALSFNGTSNYVSIPSGINTSNFSGNQITVEGWFNATQSFSTAALIGESYEGDGTVKFALFSELSGGNQLIRAGFYSNATNWQQVTSSTNLSFNQWTHIAATYDQSNIKIYVNGTLTATLANSNALPSGSERWLLGKKWDTSNCFPGIMDEVRIWNVARTQTQIQDSMNSTISPSTSGLVGYYKLDESSGTSVTDATGHGYDGTVN